MTSLTRYFLWFFFICFVLTCVCGVLAALLPQGLGGVLTAVPYLVAMIAVLYKFIKQQHRAPNQAERRTFTLGFSVIFWGYNFIFLLLGLFIFAQHDAEVWQNFMLYLKQPQFISMIVILFLLLAIPLYVLTYWFYGKQAERMATKIRDQS